MRVAVNHGDFADFSLYDLDCSNVCTFNSPGKIALLANEVRQY